MSGTVLRAKLFLTPNLVIAYAYSMDGETDRQSSAIAGEGIRTGTQDPFHKQGHSMAGGTETVLLSSVIVTLLMGPGVLSGFCVSQEQRKP